MSCLMPACNAANSKKAITIVCRASLNASQVCHFRLRIRHACRRPFKLLLPYKMYTYIYEHKRHICDSQHMQTIMHTSMLRLFTSTHTHLRKHTLKAIIPDIRNLHELSAFTLINQFCSTATASACTCCALIELISIMRIVALLMCAQL